MTYDPTDPKQVRVEQAKKRLREQQRMADWAWVCSDPRGQRIVRDLVAPLLAKSFADNPLTSAFIEGQREIARGVYALATVAGFDALAAIYAAERQDVRGGDPGPDGSNGDGGG